MNCRAKLLPFERIIIFIDWKWVLCFFDRASWIDYTGCPRRNGQNIGRVFLMFNYTDITQNTYIQSWTVTEIMTIEKCGLLGCPRIERRPWRHTHPLRMHDNEKPLANIGMQWPWRDNAQLRPASITWKPKDKCDSSASVFVVKFNGFMSLTS